MKIQNGFEYDDLKNSSISKKNIFIVASKWNNEIVSMMIGESVKYLESLGVANVEVLRVPGAWEIPFGSLKAIERGADGIIAFGAIIKGETPHFDIISKTSSQALMDITLKTMIPVANGILATNNLDQAVDRASPSFLNKGKEVTQSLLEMMEI